MSSICDYIGLDLTDQFKFILTIYVLYVIHNVYNNTY